MRPRQVRRVLGLMAFGALSAGVFMADFLAWAATR